MLVTKHFVHLTGMKERATLLYMSSVAGLTTPVPGNNAYDISKLADLQLAAFVALENPNITAIAFYPCINTDLPCRRCRVLPSFRKGHARIGWRGY
jgi:NAD(P)-dependent dehydrogenase (short-subunit alcohol dehydrogenase family)